MTARAMRIIKCRAKINIDILYHELKNVSFYASEYDLSFEDVRQIIHGVLDDLKMAITKAEEEAI